VWEGITAGTQRRLEERGPALIQTPAAVRFLSYEPALGPLNFSEVPYPVHFLRAVDWVISGAESGHHRRPSDLEWFRSVAAQCEKAGVAHFHKQRWIDGKLESLPAIDGRIYAEFPREGKFDAIY
jgi:protein gp37